MVSEGGASGASELFNPGFVMANATQQCMRSFVKSLSYEYGWKVDFLAHICGESNEEEGGHAKTAGAVLDDAGYVVESAGPLKNSVSESLLSLRQRYSFLGLLMQRRKGEIAQEEFRSSSAFSNI